MATPHVASAAPVIAHRVSQAMKRCARFLSNTVPLRTFNHSTRRGVVDAGKLSGRSDEQEVAGAAIVFVAALGTGLGYADWPSAAERIEPLPRRVRRRAVTIVEFSVSMPGLPRGRNAPARAMKSTVPTCACSIRISSERVMARARGSGRRMRGHGTLGVSRPPLRPPGRFGHRQGYQAARISRLSLR